MLKILKSLRPQIGQTPLIQLQEGALNLHVKLEYENWTGSIKIRPAYAILKAGIENGRIRKNTTVIESTSGNFGVALAHLCQALDLRLVLVVDPNISSYYEKIITNLGALLIKVTTRDDTGGYLKTRLSKLAELRSEIPDSFWPNQYENCNNALAHYEGTGTEICAQCECLDFAFVGVSTAGTLAGLSRRLKEKFPQIKIIAVDAVGSVIFGAEPKPRCIPGIGSSMAPALVKQAVIDDVVWVSDAESVAGCHALRKRHALYAGGSSGSCYAAIGKYFKIHATRKPAHIFFPCADRGEAYEKTVYDPEWAKCHCGLIHES